MFEVGFSELCMVALVAILVIGPEKLPQVARIAGFWLGKSQRMIAKLKAEAQAELRAAELPPLLDPHTELKQLQDLLSDTDSAIASVRDASLSEALALQDGGDTAH